MRVALRVAWRSATWSGPREVPSGANGGPPPRRRVPLHEPLATPENLDACVPRTVLLRSALSVHFALNEETGNAGSQQEVHAIDSRGRDGTGVHIQPNTRTLSEHGAFHKCRIGRADTSPVTTSFVSEAPSRDDLTRRRPLHTV